MDSIDSSIDSIERRGELLACRDHRLRVSEGVEATQLTSIGPGLGPLSGTAQTFGMESPWSGVGGGEGVGRVGALQVA